jgi:hypothetical protein
MPRIRKHRLSPYTITAGGIDADGVDTSIAGTVVEVFDDVGVSVGTYTPAVTDGDLVATIPAADLDIDTYSAVWAVTVSGVAEEYETHFEIVSDVYFEPYEFRAAVPSLDTAITDTDIEDIRTAVEDTFERSARRAFVPRRARETITGDGSRLYELEHPSVRELVSVTVDGTVVTATLRASGFIELPYATYGAIAVEYLHGMWPSPPQLKRLAIIYAESLIGAFAVDARATGQQTEYGYIRYSVAGRDGATGIPEVDAFLSSDPTIGGYGFRRIPL